MLKVEKGTQIYNSVLLFQENKFFSQHILKMIIINKLEKRIDAFLWRIKQDLKNQLKNKAKKFMSGKISVSSKNEKKNNIFHFLLYWKNII